MVLFICVFGISIALIAEKKETYLYINAFRTTIDDIAIYGDNIVVPMDEILRYLETTTFSDTGDIKYISHGATIYKIDVKKDVLSINGQIVSRWTDYGSISKEKTNYTYIELKRLISILTAIEDNRISYYIHDKSVYIDYEPEYFFNILEDIDITINGVTNNITGYRVKDFINDNEKVVVPFTKVIEAAGMKPKKEGQRIIYAHGGNEYAIDLEEKKLYLNGNDFLKYYDNTIKSDSFGPDYMRNKCFIWKDEEIYVDVDLLSTYLSSTEDNCIRCTYEDEGSIRLIVSLKEDHPVIPYHNLCIDGKKTDIKDSYNIGDKYILPLNKVLPQIGFNLIYKGEGREYYLFNSNLCIINYNTHTISYKGLTYTYSLDDYHRYDNKKKRTIEWTDDTVYIDFDTLYEMTEQSTVNVSIDIDRNLNMISLRSKKLILPHGIISDEEEVPNWKVGE